MQERQPFWSPDDGLEEAGGAGAAAGPRLHDLHHLP